MPFPDTGPLGSAVDLTFRTPDGGTLVLRAVDLVSINDDAHDVVSFGGFHVRSTDVTATLRLYRGEDGHLAEYREPAAPDTTPIYDRLALECERLDRIRRALARIDHHRGDTP